MKYLCLLDDDTGAFARASPAELAVIGPACRPHDPALKASGPRVTQGSLRLPGTWRSIRPATGVPTVTNGPVSAGPRQAGAFRVIEADAEARALIVASGHAAANVGEHLGLGVDARVRDTFESYPG